MKLVKPGSIFRLLSSMSIYEDDYVASILLAQRELFPGYLCGKFSPKVESEYGTSQPDLVLVDKRYRNWFVVEVELEHHSLRGHVEPQIRRLMNGIYTNAHAVDIHRCFPDASLHAIGRLVRSAQPEIVVIAPDMRPRWIPILKSLGATLMVFQVYENDHGERVYAVDGEEITRFEDHVIGTATRTAAMRTALRLSGVSEDDLSAGIDLLFNDELTRWKVVRAGADVLLLPRDRCPLPEAFTESYQITSVDDGTWRLESIGN